jgi:diguanylate cyclase (GGDEF)-like protein/PAS domain S-box-containing protein
MSNQASGNQPQRVPRRARSVRDVGESEAARIAMVESSLDAIVGMDEAGRITEFNPAAERMFGYARQDAMGKEMAELLIPERLRQRHRRGLAVYLETGHGPFIGTEVETVAVNARGEEFPVELAVTKLDMPGPPRFTGYIRNITERLRLWEQIRHSHDRIIDILETMPAAFMAMDDRFRLTFVNDLAARLLRKAKEDLLGKVLWDEFPQAVGTSFYDAGLLAMKERRPVDVEDFYPAFDAWFEVHAHPVDGGLSLYFRDVSERRRAEESNRQLAAIVEGSDDAIIGKDLDGIIRSWNPGAERLYGYTAAEMIGKHISILAPADRVEEMAALLGRIRGGDSVQHFDTIRLRRDGREVSVSLSVSPVRNGEGEVMGASVITRDMTERKRLETLLTHQALHDYLTGLANRALFMDHLTQALARARRHADGIAVMFMDLDRFKLINDSLGHQAGDRLLRDVGDRLRRVIRPNDTLARFGGDEFTLLCEDISDEAQAEQVARRVVSLLSEPFILDGREVFLTASIGIALADGEMDADTLLRSADAAMYRAKERGKARFEFFDKDARIRPAGSLETENALRRAMERDELVVFYQPEVDLATGSVMGVEALVRWNHPQRGIVLPDEFIGVAEESGLIVPIGAWVLREACQQAAAWRASDPERRLMVSVNLSARQLEMDDLLDVVSSTLAETRTDPNSLCLEVTESVLMGEGESMLETVLGLKCLGVRLSIDDFGTGYSSLSHLKRFPIDYLKVDRSFVQGLGRDSGDSAIVSSVVNLAHALGLSTVAEGVETAQQLAELRAMGCDAAQGFHMARPKPHQEVVELLDGRRHW